MMALCGFEKLQRLGIQTQFPLTLLELPNTLENFKLMVRSIDLPVLLDILDQKLPRSIQTVKLGVDYPFTWYPRHGLESGLRAFCKKRRWEWLVYHPHSTTPTVYRYLLHEPYQNHG